MSSNPIKANMSEHLFPVINSLHRNRDADSIKHIRSILTSLILAGVIDEKCSLIDLGEYCDSLVQDIETPSEANSESLGRLKELLLSDIAE